MRHYHTLEHIDACLAWLDEVKPSAEYPAEIELALWFHDAIYDPRAKDNERRSAELARRRLQELGVSRAVRERIADYVLATQKHIALAGDAALLVDLDLTILGADPAEFDRFEQQIRQEYQHVPEPMFRMGRSRVLKTFLDRPQIYVIPAVRWHLENAARRNLQRRIKQLSLFDYGAS
jgi:predicted metal-dependent HD superfamily phosphohydrolase